VTVTRLVDPRLADTVGVLFGRTLKTRYRGSFLGVLWSAVSPFAMAAVYSAIFGRVFASHYGNSVVRYASAVYIGLTVSQLFIAGTAQALPSIVAGSGLLNKIKIPFEAFPLSIVAAYGFQQLIGTLPVLIVLTLIDTRDPLHVIALLVPLAALAMLTVGVALIVSGADVFFRDVPYIYDLLTFFILLTSPVFYPASIVAPHVLRFLALNPLFQIMEELRILILTRGWPDLGTTALTLGEGALVLVAGVAAFAAMRGHFMEEL
jgi:ABC-type polysaccharide/polyol phosphate export permease